MAGERRLRAGKILAVVDLVRQHENALRVDLMKMGQRLETCNLGWKDMWALLVASPPYTAIHYGINEKWTLTDHILVTILDRQNTMLWTKTTDAHAKPPRNEPQRVPRPGVDDRPETQQQPGQPMDIAEYEQRQIESGGYGS